MGWKIAGVGFLLGVAVTFAAQTSVDQAHEQLTIATRNQDATAWSSVVTDDLLIVRSDGRTQNRAQRLEEIKQVWEAAILRH